MNRKIAAAIIGTLIGTTLCYAAGSGMAVAATHNKSATAAQSAKDYPPLPPVRPAELGGARH